MLISTALLLDSNIRNSLCTPAKLPCRRVEVGYEIVIADVPPIIISLAASDSESELEFYSDEDLDTIP
jgi:hypothetical protein